jgi:hypothetical protein
MSGEKEIIVSKVIPKDRREPADRALVFLPPKNAPRRQVIHQVHTVGLGLRGTKQHESEFRLDSGK